MKSQITSLKNFFQFFFMIPVFMLFMFYVLPFTFSQAHAATGLNRVINFQGRVVNKSDGTNVTDGTYSFTFKLYDAASGGNLLWQETQSSVQVTSGIFQVSLGSSTAFNAGGYNVDFKQNNLYLDITFNGETFGSRIQLAAVPQAIDSEQLDGVVATQSASGFTMTGGLSTSDTLTVNGNITIGSTITPTSAGGLTVQSNGANALSLDTGGAATVALGNTNANAIAIGNNSATNNTAITLTTGGSGVVTIGSNTGTGNVLIQPNAGGQAALIIKDQGLGDLFTASAGATPKFTIANSGASSQSGSLTFDAAATIATTNMQNLTIGGSTTGAVQISPKGTTGLYIDSFGNVGIGNNNPGSEMANLSNSTLLDLKGSNPTFQLGGLSNPPGAVIQNTNASGTSYKRASFASNLYWDNTSNTWNVSTLGNNDFTAIISENNAGIGFYTAASTGSAAFQMSDHGTNGLESYRRMTIDKNGNVGIGTTAPQSALNLTTGDILQVGLNTDSYYTQLGTNALTFNRASSPSYIQQNGIGGSLSFRVSNLSTDDTTAMTILSSGNVGIGTTNPTAPLHIVASSGNIIKLDTSTGLASDNSNIQFNSDRAEVGYDGANTAAYLQAGSGNGLELQTNGANTALYINSSGNVGIGTSTPLTSTGLDIEKNGLGNSLLDINQLGSGDIFTASASGATVFSITNAGSAVFRGDPLNIGSGATGNGSNAIHNDLGDTGSLLPNPGFESAVTNAIADAWYPAATTSAGIFSHDTSTRAKGDASLKVVQTNSVVAIYSSCVPVSGAIGKYILNYYAIGSSTTKATVGSFMDGYISKANCEADTSPTIVAVKVAPTTASWAVYGTGTNTAIASFGSTAVWARVHFIISTTGTSVQTNIDGVSLTEDMGSTGNGGLDYAENYPVNPDNMPQPGDVVAMDPTSTTVGQVIPDNIPSDQDALGIVSTNPGQVLSDGSSATEVPIALAGRVPVHVSTANGPIRIGDYLTSSSIPGVAVKALGVGPTIGVAMQNYTADGVGTITVFVNRSYYAGANGLSGANGLTTLIGQDGTPVTLTVENGQLVIKAADGTNAITFDKQGNANFAGIITAKEIKADRIDGLDALSNEIASLSATIATQSGDGSQPAVLGVATSSGDLSLNSLSVNGLATVSADLRVKGNSLVEGMLTVLDSLMAQNVIINGTADVFGTVIFHTAPTFTSDTAGIATVTSGKDHIDISFSHAYDTVPVVNANIVSLTPSLDPQQTIFSKGYSYIITNVSASGFTIQLNKTADSDVDFSWTALEVRNASN